MNEMGLSRQGTWCMQKKQGYEKAGNLKNSRSLYVAYMIETKESKKLRPRIKIKIK